MYYKLHHITLKFNIFLLSQENISIKINLHFTATEYVIMILVLFNSVSSSARTFKTKYEKIIPLGIQSYFPISSLSDVSYKKIPP